MRLVLVALLISSAAHADDVPPLTYASVTCGQDDTSRDFVVLPGGAIVDEKQLAAMVDAAGTSKAPAAKVSKRIEGSTWRGGWCYAQVAVKAGKQALSLVVTGAGEYTGAGSDKLIGNAGMIAKPVADKDAAKLPAPPAIDGDGGGSDWVKALSAGLATPEKQAALWAAKRDDLILVGSAPGEVYQGAAAKATLAKWKLSFALEGGIRADAVASSDGQIGYVYANVTAKPVKGGAAVTYRGFFVLLADHFNEQDEAKRPAKDTWHLVLAHFAR